MVPFLSLTVVDFNFCSYFFPCFLIQYSDGIATLEKYLADDISYLGSRVKRRQRKPSFSAI